jgi:ligand-binding sensor domain-containing protein
MPSDSVFSIHISNDGTQWIGTDKGIARHVGFNTLAGWTVLDTEAGLAHNKVQAIKSDSKGVLYFGTKNGLSVYDGTNWKTFRTADGLVSNNILSITVDKSNAVWLGTDNGVSCLKGGKITSYK